MPIVNGEVEEVCLYKIASIRRVKLSWVNID